MGLNPGSFNLFPFFLWKTYDGVSDGADDEHDGVGDHVEEETTVELEFTLQWRHIIEGVHHWRHVAEGVFQWRHIGQLKPVLETHYSSFDCRAK